MVATILTSEGALVRTQLRPPESPGRDVGLGLPERLSRSSDRHLTVVMNVDFRYSASQTVSGWHAGRV